MATTKKDFAAIASAINNALKGRGDLIGNVAAELAATNPRFDKARFARACLEGIEEEKDTPLTLEECEVGMEVKVISVTKLDMEYVTVGAAGVIDKINPAEHHQPIRVVLSDVDDYDWLSPEQLTRA